MTDGQDWNYARSVGNGTFSSTRVPFPGLDSHEQCPPISSRRRFILERPFPPEIRSGPGVRLGSICNAIGVEAAPVVRYHQRKLPRPEYERNPDFAGLRMSYDVV